MDKIRSNLSNKLFNKQNFKKVPQKKIDENHGKIEANLVKMKNEFFKFFVRKLKKFEKNPHII